MKEVYRMVDDRSKVTYNEAFKTYNRIAEMCGILKKEYGDIITLDEMFVAFKLMVGYDESDIWRLSHDDLYGYAPLIQVKDSD